MVNSVEELKKLILWAKEQKVKSISVAGVSFELSDLALVEDMISIEDKTVDKDNNVVVQKDLVDSLPEVSDDEELFWSTR